MKAYKLNILETDDIASFRLSDNPKFADWLERTNSDLGKLTSEGGIISIQVDLVKKVIEHYEELDLGKWEKEKLEKDIEGLDNQDWVNYYCY